MAVTLRNFLMEQWLLSYTGKVSLNTMKGESKCMCYFWPNEQNPSFFYNSCPFLSLQLSSIPYVWLFFLFNHPHLQYVGRKNNFSCIPLGSWLRYPCAKRQINRRKTSRRLITCLPPVCVGGTQENWYTPRNGPSDHLKNYLQLKRKDVWGWGWGASYGGYQETHSKQG